MCLPWNVEYNRAFPICIRVFHILDKIDNNANTTLYYVKAKNSSNKMLKPGLSSTSDSKSNTQAPYKVMLY